VHRGRKDGRCTRILVLVPVLVAAVALVPALALALAADAKLDKHRVRFAADILCELNHRADHSLAQVGDVEPM